MREEEIVILCKNGEYDARKELYETYSSRLLGILMRYVGNRATAEDLLHESFIKIFESFGKFTWRGEGSLKAWLDRVVVNYAIEYLRKSKKGNTIFSVENLPERYDEPTYDDLKEIPQSVLMQFIQDLPDGYRTVFNLYVFENKSHKEIAKTLGINEKTSSSQLSRAKYSLATKINNYLRAVKKD